MLNWKESGLVRDFLLKTSASDGVSGDDEGRRETGPSDLEYMYPVYTFRELPINRFHVKFYYNKTSHHNT